MSCPACVARAVAGPSLNWSSSLPGLSKKETNINRIKILTQLELKEQLWLDGLYGR